MVRQIHISSQQHRGEAQAIVVPDFSRSVLDAMLGQIVAPVVDGQVVLPQIAAVDTPLDPKLERQMRKWCVGKVCAVCGGSIKVQAHHIYPRHIWPQLMWRPESWYPLCRGNPEIDCHCIIGHGGNFSGYNPFCVAMAEQLRPILRGNKVILAAIRQAGKEAAKA